MRAILFRSGCGFCLLGRFCLLGSVHLGLGLGCYRDLEVAIDGVLLLVGRLLLSGFLLQRLRLRECLASLLGFSQELDEFEQLGLVQVGEPVRVQVRTLVKGLLERAAGEVRRATCGYLVVASE